MNKCTICPHWSISCYHLDDDALIVVTEKSQYYHNDLRHRSAWFMLLAYPETPTYTYSSYLGGIGVCHYKRCQSSVPPDMCSFWTNSLADLEKVLSVLLLNYTIGGYTYMVRKENFD